MMAARDARDGNCWQRGRCASREDSAQDGSATGSFRQRSGACPHGGVWHCGVPWIGLDAASARPRRPWL